MRLPDPRLHRETSPVVGPRNLPQRRPRGKTVPLHKIHQTGACGFEGFGDENINLIKVVMVFAQNQPISLELPILNAVS